MGRQVTIRSRACGRMWVGVRTSCFEAGGLRGLVTCQSYLSLVTGYQRCSRRPLHGRFAGDTCGTNSAQLLSFSTASTTTTLPWLFY